MKLSIHFRQTWCNIFYKQFRIFILQGFVKIIKGLLEIICRYIIILNLFYFGFATFGHFFVIPFCDCGTRSSFGVLGTNKNIKNFFIEWFDARTLVRFVERQFSYLNQEKRSYQKCLKGNTNQLSETEKVHLVQMWIHCGFLE